MAGLRVRVKGLPALRKFSRALSGAKRFKRGTLAAMHTVAAELVKQPFKDKASPFGKTWKPRKREPGWPLLDRTGTLKGGQRAKVVSRGISFGNATPYASFQNPARPFIPRALPPKWRAALQKVILEELTELFE